MVDAKNTLILFFTLIAFSLITSIITSAAGQNDLEKVSNSVDKIRNTAPLALAYFLVVRVAAEEVFFRGFLVKKLGIAGSSVVFGLAHFFYGSVAEVIGAMILGAILAVAFNENKSIYPNIAAHFFYNLVFLAVLF
ncbi:MAG: CPBP family intramembrane glutamic endopeptidase [archaeon]